MSGRGTTADDLDYADRKRDRRGIPYRSKYIFPKPFLK